MPTSNLQMLKRAMVSLLVELAHQYTIANVTITQDSLDADIKRTFRRVILEVHPDKGRARMHAQHQRLGLFGPNLIKTLALYSVSQCLDSLFS